MSLFSPYLFLELALFVFVLGFGWEQWRLRELWSRGFALTAVGLALFWFAIDQIAVHINHFEPSLRIEATMALHLLFGVHGRFG